MDITGINMKAEIQAIRLQNFERLIQEAGSIAELARRCSYDKAVYLYQLAAQKTKPNGTTMGIGNRTAAKLEAGMAKPAGWLSEIHSEQTPNMTSHTMPASYHTAGTSNRAAMQTITLAFTGASGLPYGMRLLEVLLAMGKTVYLVYSQAAQIVAQQEMNFNLPASPKEAQAALCQHFACSPTQLQVFGSKEWFAPIASGSAVADAMVVCPASMGTVAAIAHGTADTLLERAADVAIKEKRPLIIVPREAPLSALHLENLLKLANLGCTILPPAAGFYHQPQSVADMIDFIVARILDQLHIEHSLMPKWGA